MSDHSTGSGSPRPFDDAQRPERVEGRAQSSGDWDQELRGRLSSLRLSPVREAEIIEELSQHLDDRRHELIAGGATPEVATRLTLDDFSADRLARFLRRFGKRGWPRTRHRQTDGSYWGAS